MRYIACIDKQGGLGYKGGLLFCIKKDLKRFKVLTTCGVVVMGYNTYKSLPNGALPNRLNIVMSKNHNVEGGNVAVVGGRLIFRIPVFARETWKTGKFVAWLRVLTFPLRRFPFL